MGEEEKKNGDSPPATDANSKNAVDVENAPKLSTTTLKPRTAGPDHYFEGTALEAMLSSQNDPTLTVKARNVAPKPAHKRGVSWDVNVPDIQDTASINQTTSADAPLPLNRGVSLPAANPTNAGRRPPIPRPPTVSRKASKDSSISSNHSPVRGRYDPRSPSSQGSSRESNNPEFQAALFLNQVSSNELNAETNLMRTLDEKDPLRQRAGTGASIFSEVPDDIEHNFVIEDENGLVLPSSRRRTSSHTREKPQKKPSERKSPAPKSHQRNMTLEQTLFGLTSALTEMKHNDHKERKERGSHHDHPDSMDSNDLFETAGMLFDRANKKNAPAKERVEDKDDSHHSSGDRPALQNQQSKKPASGWGIVKNNLDELKKTDGDKSQASDPLSHDVEQGIDEVDEDSEMAYSGDTHEESDDNPVEQNKKSRFNWMKKQKKHNPFRHLPYAGKVKEEWDVFNKFLNPRKQSMRMYVKIILFYIMIPATAIAGILFYWADNPPDGICEDQETGCVPRKEYASASWWILFIGCRQVVIACLAKLTEAFVIDFLALRTQFTLRLFGPMVTLLLVQSRGWPFLM
ncbi:MAG: hypothetical protein SGILL_007486 [Bacillariaceae sp.]